MNARKLTVLMLVTVLIAVTVPGLMSEANADTSDSVIINVDGGSAAPSRWTWTADPSRPSSCT